MYALYIVLYSILVEWVGKLVSIIWGKGLLVQCMSFASSNIIVLG